MNDLLHWKLNSQEHVGCGFPSGSGVVGKVRGRQGHLGEGLELPLNRQLCAALSNGSPGTSGPHPERR
jgi:hypothetical protein